MLAYRKKVFPPNYRRGREFALGSPALVMGLSAEDFVGRFAEPTHPFTAQGRNLCLNGNFELGATTGFSAVNSATLSVQTGTPHGGTYCLRIVRNGANNAAARQNIPINCLLRITGYARGDGTAKPLVNLNATNYFTGTVSNSWQPFDFIVFSTDELNLVNDATSGSNYVEFDDIQIFELNIPSSVKSFGTQLLADGDQEAADTSAYTAQSATLTKQTSNPYQGTRVLRIATASAAAGQANQIILTIGKRYRATGKARGDGTCAPAIRHDASTPFTGTSSTNWQNFEVSFLATETTFRLRQNSAAIGYVEFDDVRVVEDLTIFPGSRIMDGDMLEVDTRWWAAGSSATLSKASGALRVARNGSNNPFARQTFLIPGKRYRIRLEMRSDGSATPRFSYGTAVDGAASTSWQAFDVTVTASQTTLDLSAITSTGAQYAEFKDVIVEEVSPFTATAHANVSLDRAANPFARKKAVFAGNAFIDIYSTVLNSTFPESRGTAVIVGYGIRGGGNEWYLLIGGSITANYIHITNETTRPGFRRVNESDDTSVNLASPNLKRDLHVFSMSWDIDTGLLEAYVDGMPYGASSGVTVWVPGRRLGSATCVIGARNNTPSNALNGDVALMALYSERKTPAWHRELGWRYGGRQ